MMASHVALGMVVRMPRQVEQHDVAQALVGIPRVARLDGLARFANEPVVLEVIEEASHKILVFVPFTHTIELLRKFLIANGITCEVISGAVSANKRSDIFDAFQTQPDPRVLIIQPQAAAHGVTLTAADTVIWYAPVTSVETYLQANARIDRPGQKHNMTVVNITGSEVEERLYTMLQSNITNHIKIVELYRQELDKSS